MAVEIVSAEEIRKAFFYDPETGVFTRRERARRAPAGAVAGNLSSGGYLQIRYRSMRFLAHRLAWLYVTGVRPDMVIDHINGNPADNRISNLRDVSTSVNMQNQRTAQPRNASGFLGVTIHGGRFEASIKLNGKNIYLGSYKTPELAHSAYLKKKREIHPGCCI